MTYYKVAGLYFSFDDKLYLLSERINYLPFQVEKLGNTADILFNLDINYELKPTKKYEQFTYTNEIGCYGVTCENNTYEWVLKKLNSEEYYYMKLDIESKKASINFEINDTFTIQAADDFVRFAFIYTAAFHNAILLHASCIKIENKGIAFIGNSGIGKSTHSSLWLQYISDSELINDDQPAVRVLSNQVFIYGTPWSGKTLCYKNLSANLTSILCMEQKPYNKLIPLNKLVLFTNLLSASSLIRSEKETLKRISLTLSQLTELVRGAKLQNRPEKEAALLAYDFFQANNSK